MTKKYEHKGHHYWITVDPAVNIKTNEMDCFFAYVSDTEPKGIFYGDLIKDEKGEPIFCNNQLFAFIQANAVKQSEINSKQG